MNDDELRNGEVPLDGAPTWVRIVQAVLIGLVAGLALHILLSMVVLQGRELWPGEREPRQCRKTAPARPPQIPLSRSITDRS
jgi:hypothetical protein